MSKETYYKAVRPDGTDFYSGRVLWDQIVEHPNPGSPGEHDEKDYLSVSVSPADCTGMKWPCRLLVVEPVEGNPVWEPDPSLPSKRASHAWRVVRELPAHEALGPNGAEVAAFLDLLPTLTNTQWDAARVPSGAAARVPSGAAAWDAAWDAARIAAWNAAGGAAWDISRTATRAAAGVSAEDAIGALLVRDLISTEQFDVLTKPMRAAGIDFNALVAAGTKSDGPAETEDDNKKERVIDALLDEKQAEDSTVESSL